MLRNPDVPKERVDHVLVLLGLARARGVHQTSTADGVGGAPQQLELIVGERARGRARPTPANVGIAANRAEARAGRIHEHAVEDRRERQRRRRGHADDVNVRAPLARTVASTAAAARPHVAGDEQARVAHGGNHRGRLAARRCAQVEHALTGGVDGERDELRRLVLDEERAVDRASAADCPT